MDRLILFSIVVLALIFFFGVRIVRPTQRGLIEAEAIKLVNIISEMAGVPLVKE